MDRHYIYINNKQLKHINYILAHECRHIQRVYNILLEERKSLKSDGLTITCIKHKLIQESEHIQIESRDQVLTYLINGLISQLLNAPVDILIEQWIYNNFKKLRNSQTKYLREYANKILLDITDLARCLTPESIYIKSNSINYVYLKSIEKLLNTNFTKNYYNNSAITELGDKLYRILNSNKDINQDNYIIDIWAKALNIDNWYYWDDFENIPSDYLQMNI